MNNVFSISVIITTFNRKNYIQKAVQSVLTQSRPADEVLVVDDGSTDGTDELVRDRFPRVRYFRQDNRGISSIRNLGIERSSGNWIAFLDVDDEWLPQKLERQVSVLKTNHDYRICYTNEIWIRRGRRVNPKKIHQKFGGDIFEKCLPLCIVSPSSVIIHRELFHRFGLFDTNLPACEDYDMWLRICAFLPVLYLDEPLIVKYGGHEDQLSRRFWGMDRFRIQSLEKIAADSRVDMAKRAGAVRMLLEKIDVYLTGARKRKKKGDVEVYGEKKRRYVDVLNSLQ